MIDNVVDESMNGTEKVHIKREYDELSSVADIGRVNWKLSFFLGALIGAIVFICIYGIRVLDVTYDDWLFMFEQDPSQHYLGWRLFRNSSWHFPFGLCDTGMYPQLTSVVYTDSIPVLCILFKIISPILPKTFQFIGLYGLFCFMMQGGISKLLLRRYINNEMICNVGSIFFVVSISFIQRMFIHTALSSHFLILLGMLFFEYRKEIGYKKKILLWILLGIVSVSTHIYIYGMISIMLMGFAMLDALDKDIRLIKKIMVFISYPVAYILTTMFCFYLLGGFYGLNSIGIIQLGVGNANINALFNSFGYSLFFKQLPAFAGQDDGLSYIGIACIILLFLALKAFLKDFKIIWKERRIELICIIGNLVLLEIFALSPVVSLGHICFSYSQVLPEEILKVWGIFRSTGRFMWPVQYTVILFSIVYSYKLLKGRMIYIFVLLAILQFVEFSGYIIHLNQNYSPRRAVTFSADVFQKYDFSGYKHIQFMTEYSSDDFYGSAECFNTLNGYTKLAVDKNLSVSYYQYARGYGDGITKEINKSFEKLLDGIPELDTIYIFDSKEYHEKKLNTKCKGVLVVDTGENVVLIPDK